MRRIPLTQGKFALVDDGDYDWLNQWMWYYSKNGYAARKNGKIVYMHNAIMNTPPGFHTDHKETGKQDYGLDNRRSNLRICTVSQNLANRGPQKNNTSGYKGVEWYKSRSNWRAKIKSAGKFVHIGYFKTAEEAAKAYDVVAKRLFGEFAFLNFPEDMQ